MSFAKDRQELSIFNEPEKALRIEKLALQT